MGYFSVSIPSTETDEWSMPVAFHSQCYDKLRQKNLPEDFARQQIRILVKLNINTADDFRKKTIKELEDGGLTTWTLEMLSSYYYSPENFDKLVKLVSRNKVVNYVDILTGLNTFINFVLILLWCVVLWVFFSFQIQYHRH